MVDIARTILIDFWLAMNYWVEAVNITFYVTNRCLIKYVIKKTPYKLLNKMKPSIAHFNLFGRKCFLLNNGKDDLGKYDTRIDEWVFVGYYFNNMTYRVL